MPSLMHGVSVSFARSHDFYAILCVSQEELSIIESNQHTRGFYKLIILKILLTSVK